VDREGEKESAARRGVALVQDGMLIGLGTGSTANHAIRLIGKRVRQGLSVRAIPSSVRSEELARAEGIPIVGFEAGTRLDLTLDGADEVDRQLCLIKGGGGALLREKIIASASQQVVILVDAGKIVPILGTFPLPVEVIPFGWQVVAERIAERDGRPQLRSGPSGHPFVTDEGHYILDCAFGSIPDPPALASWLDGIPGVVEHGLFVDLAHVVIVGRGEETEILGRSA
jgi:ribose 5-phosphate isomerase A